jgi:hypothetical protein
MSGNEHIKFLRMSSGRISLINKHQKDAETEEDKMAM